MYFIKKVYSSLLAKFLRIKKKCKKSRDNQFLGMSLFPIKICKN